MDISVLLVLIVVLVAGFIAMQYNAIIAKFNAVERAWASVLTQERQKTKLSLK